MDCNAAVAVQIGWMTEQVVDRLDLAVDPQPYDGPAGGTWYDFSALCGVMIFFGKQGLVRTLVFEAPFTGEIRGIRLGDRKALVRKVLGPPHRLWPVEDKRTDCWLYDRPEFLSISFDEFGHVERIIR